MTSVSREVVLGVVLVAAGVVLIGADLELWGRVSLWQLWPVAIIAAGLRSGALQRHGFGSVGVGVVLLLFTTRLLDWRDWWPLLVVVHGLSLMLPPSGSSCGRKKETSHVR
jgi:hypothetical protein